MYVFGKAVAFGRLERQCFRWRFERKKKRKASSTEKKRLVVTANDGRPTRLDEPG